MGDDMIHNSEPSALFIDTIHAGYHIEAARGEVTCSLLWNHVVWACLQRRKGFEEMFEWDIHLKPHQKRNRIADIAEVIKQGYIPGMRLATNDRGREIVIHEEMRDG